MSMDHIVSRGCKHSCAGCAPVKLFRAVSPEHSKQPKKHQRIAQLVAVLAAVNHHKKELDDLQTFAYTNFVFFN